MTVHCHSFNLRFIFSIFNAKSVNRVAYPFTDFLILILMGFNGNESHNMGFGVDMRFKNIVSFLDLRWPRIINATLLFICIFCLDCKWCFSFWVVLFLSEIHFYLPTVFLLQPVVVYNFSEIKINFSASFWNYMTGDW